jgi:hypothetical protein
MTIVTMPDGVPVDFGDMPPDQIKALIQKKFPDFAKPPPEKSWYGEEPGIAAKLLQGAGSVATGVSDVMSGRVDPKSDQGIANITDAALLGAPVGAASRGGLGWAGVERSRKLPVKTPAADELIKTGGKQHDLVRDLDVRYHVKPVQNLAFKLQSKLFKDGYRDRAESAHDTFAELKELLKPSEEGAFMGLDDLLAVRRSLQKTAQNFNKPTDQKAAIEAIKALDEFIEVPDPASVMAGDAAAAGALWKDARANYATGKQSEKLLGLENKTNRRAKASNSGLNIDNTIRQRVSSLLERPDLTSGLTAADLARLEEVARGTATRNTIRWAGNLLGGGAGVAGGIAGGAGYAAFGPLGTAAAVAAPLGAKMLGNKLTKNALFKAEEAIRKRSPLYQERLANAPLAPPPLMSPGARSTMGRAVPLVRNGRSYGPAPEPQMTKEQYEEYLRQKYAQDQGA